MLPHGRTGLLFEATNPQSMEIRPLAGREDVPGIVCAHGRAWQTAYDGLLPDSVLEDITTSPTDEDVQRWLEGFRENEDGVLVATVDDRVVGFAEFRWGDVETKSFVDDGEAGLKAIYVDPDLWDEGVGTALLEAGIERLPRSVDTVRLEVFVGNERGRQFYEARGFEATETTKTEVAGERYDAVVYTLRLSVFKRDRTTAPHPGTRGKHTTRGRENDR